MALPFRNRLNLRFNRHLLVKKGNTHRTPLFTFITSSNNLPHSRYAILLSRKFSPLAVTRNKIKRLITETLRLNLETFPSSYDVLIIPQKKVISTSQDQLVPDLLYQLRNLKNIYSFNHQSQPSHEKKHTFPKNN